MDGRAPGPSYELLNGRQSYSPEDKDLPSSSEGHAQDLVDKFSRRCGEINFNGLLSRKRFQSPYPRVCHLCVSWDGGNLHFLHFLFISCYKFPKRRFIRHPEPKLPLPELRRNEVLYHQLKAYRAKTFHLAPPREHG